jgi:cytoskeletal protein CcmA (bactofilin family)
MSTTFASTAVTATTVIGATMRIKGSLKTTENVNLNGEFEGQMDIQGRLVVGPEGKAIADLKVGELLVAGLVKGNVDAEQRVSLKQGANLQGDVKTPGIVIEDGAFFKGGIDIKRPENPVK